jgi:sphingomyelin phosphodiesterase
VTFVLQRLALGPEEICGFVIGDACGDVYNPYHEWKISFPPVPKPPVAPLIPPKASPAKSVIFKQNN